MMKKHLFSRTDIINLNWMIGSEFVTKISKVVTVSLLIRILGVEQFGLYTSAIALIAILGFVFDFGLGISILKILGKRQKSEELILPIFVVKLIYIILASILLFFITKTHLASSTKEIIAIIFFWYVINELIALMFLVLRAQGKAKHEMNLRMIYATISPVALIALMLLGRYTFHDVILSQILCQIITLCYSVINLTKMFGLKSFGSRRKFLPASKMIFSNTWKIGPLNSVIMLFSATDPFLISQFYNSELMGNYSVAMRVLIIMQMPILILIPAMYRIMYNNEDQSVLSIEKYSFTFKLSFLFSVGISIFVYQCSPLLTNILAGDDFSSSVVILKCLAVGLPGYYMFPLFTQALIMKNANKSLFITYLIFLSTLAGSLTYAGIRGYSINVSCILIALNFTILAIVLGAICLWFNLFRLDVSWLNIKIFIIFTFIYIGLSYFNSLTFVDLLATTVICLIGFICATLEVFKQR